jgi:hypothetical protein
VHEREETAGRRRAAHLAEVEVVEVLGVLSDRVVSNYRYMSAAEVLSSLLTSSQYEKVKGSIILCGIKRQVKKWFPRLLKKSKE